MHDYERLNDFCVALSTLCSKYNITLTTYKECITPELDPPKIPKFIWSFYDTYLIDDIANHSLLTDEEVEVEWSKMLDKS